MPIETSPATTTATLPASGRRWRLLVTVAVLGGLAFGTFIGDDDNFPFAPFRMFSTTNSPDGRITWLGLQKQVDGGEWVGTSLSWTNVGINRAELEGQLHKVVDDPEMLGMLADTHLVLNPGADEWSAVRVIRRAQQLEDSRPVGEVTEEVLVSWERDE